MSGVFLTFIRRFENKTSYKPRFLPKYLNSYYMIYNTCAMNRILISLVQKAQQNGRSASFYVKALTSMESPQLNSSQRSIHFTFTSPAKILEEKKKTKIVTKITLIGLDQSMSITGLEDAQKLAKRRGLQLVKVQDMDPKTNRPVFKLLTQAELIDVELEELNPSTKTFTAKEKSGAKVTEKSLTISSRIADNDLNSRLKNIHKWLGKTNRVRVLIQGGVDETAKCDKIMKAIEKSITEPNVIGKIVQKSTKNSVIKFIIIPVQLTSENSTKSNA